jgi:hypothetical protein
MSKKRKREDKKVHTGRLSKVGIEWDKKRK